MTKICAFCEREFTPLKPRYQRFCSRDCQVRNWRDVLWQRNH